jgi:hypothetical protein
MFVMGLFLTLKCPSNNVFYVGILLTYIYSNPSNVLRCCRNLINPDRSKNNISDLFILLLKPQMKLYRTHSLYKNNVWLFEIHRPAALV